MLAANERYADQVDLGDVPDRATPGLAVLPNMDSRIEPSAI